MSLFSRESLLNLDIEASHWHGRRIWHTPFTCRQVGHAATGEAPECIQAPCLHAHLRLAQEVEQEWHSLCISYGLLTLIWATVRLQKEQLHQYSSANQSAMEDAGSISYGDGIILYSHF